MFLVCASTTISSIRIGVAGPIEAQAKLLELSETWQGNVLIYDAAGTEICPDDLSEWAKARRLESADSSAPV